MLAQHPPTTNAATDRLNPANHPFKSELTQCFLLLYLLSLCRPDPDPIGFISHILPLVSTDCWFLPAGLLCVAACLGVLSDEDPSVVPGGAAGVSLHPWTQWLPGGVRGLRPAHAAAASAAASLQHHGEYMCVCVCVPLLMKVLSSL